MPSDNSINWLGILAVVSNVLLWAVNYWRRLEDRLLEARLKVIETAMAAKLDHEAVVRVAREFSRDLREDFDEKHRENIDRWKETNESVKHIENLLMAPFRGGTIP
jgi:transposase-like protein